MAYYLLTTLLLIFSLLVCLSFIHMVIHLKRDWPTTSKAWKQMEPFEKSLFYIGLIFFISIPVLKEHPAASLYFAKVLIEILPALAGSFFVAGVLAFMRQVQLVKQNAGQVHER